MSQSSGAHSDTTVTCLWCCGEFWHSGLLCHQWVTLVWAGCGVVCWTLWVKLAGGAASSPPTGKQPHVCAALCKLCKTDGQHWQAGLSGAISDSDVKQMSEETRLMDKWSAMPPQIPERNLLESPTKKKVAICKRETEERWKSLSPGFPDFPVCIDILRVRLHTNQWRKCMIHNVQMLEIILWCHQPAVWDCSEGRHHKETGHLLPPVYCQTSSHVSE